MMTTGPVAMARTSRIPTGLTTGPTKERMTRPGAGRHPPRATQRPALGAGAGVSLAITRGLDRSAAPPASPGGQPSYAAPGGNGGGTVPGGGVPGGGVPGGGGATGEMFIAGPVVAVSDTSITIGGPGRQVTAAVTSATKITGEVTSIGSIRDGDDVSAQITVGSSGKATAAAIQDPAQAPSADGGLP
jgi:hypothetical protein